MSGVRPIEMIVQAALSEQAPTGNLHSHFYTAELLLVFIFWISRHILNIVMMIKRGSL